MTNLHVTSVSSLLCQASTCFRIGSKFRCIRSTPTEMQSIRENDFECFASTGVKSPVTMSLNSGCPEVQTSSKRTSGPEQLPDCSSSDRDLVANFSDPLMDTHLVVH